MFETRGYRFPTPTHYSCPLGVIKNRMGFKVGKDVPPMERELIYLLYDLCVKWGFCIPPNDHYEISKKEYYYAIEFAQDVVKAEGMEGYSGWVNRIAERFRERFGTYEIDSSTFVDRVKGIEENW